MDVLGQQSLPVFSVVMPSFNVEDYIEHSIQSVLSQTCQNFELIVVDDGSTDRTREIVTEIARRDTRVSLISNERPRGPAGARNCGVSTTNGEWLCFLDSDDLLTPEALSSRLAAIEHYEDCDFFSSDFVFWYPEDVAANKRKTDTNKVWQAYFNRADSGGKLVALDRPLDAFLETVLAWTGGVALRKSLFQKLGGFNESLPRGEDDHLWLRAAASSSQLVLIREVTAFYRQRMTGITQGTGSLSPYAPIMFRMLLRDPLFSGREKIIGEKRARHIYINCLNYREHGSKRAAIKTALQYWSSRPFDQLAIRNLLACILLRR